MLRAAVAITAAAIVAIPTAPARAEPPRAPEPAGELARQKECVRSAAKELSKVTFTRKDVERLLAEWKGFDALGEDVDEEGDAVCFQVGRILADPKFVAWAKGRGLDPRGFLLASARISMTWVRHTAPAKAARGRAQLEAQRTELRSRCASMGPSACGEVEKGFADAEKLLREAEGFTALFPAPTTAEVKLLDEYGPRLERVMGDSDDASPGEADGDAEEDGQH